MNIQVDFRSKIPIYIQIVDQIKHLVAIGELKPGDQLPTVRQLAADLRVNFNTVARAYRLLDEEGLISTQHGRGTYILPPASERNGEQLRRDDLDWLTKQFLNDAAALMYSPAEIKKVVLSYIEQWEQRGTLPPLH